MQCNSTELWIDAILDNITDTKLVIDSGDIDYPSIMKSLREQYRLLAVLRKVKKRKAVIKGFYRGKLKGE